MYNSLVLSVIHGCETWTILKSEERKLEAFQMSCHRRILRIHWFDHVTNADVNSQMGREDLAQSHPQATYGGLWTCSSTTGRQQVGWHYSWLLTHGQDADPTTIHVGSVDMGDHDTPGSVRWRSMLVSLLMMHGTLQPIAVISVSVGIDLKELGGGWGQLPKCVKFCPGIAVYSRFSLKNERLYRHELGGSTPPPQPPSDNSNPG